jgi:hypothetical protein
VSREELGDAIAETADRIRRALSGAAPGLPNAPSAPTAPRVKPADRADVAPAALLAVLLGAIGWFAASAWMDGAETPVRDGPVGWAVVLETRPRGESGTRALVDVVVQVTNLDRTPVTLTGAETTFDAGAIEAVAPDSLALRPGAGERVTVHAAVGCRSPLPLRLFPLQFRRVDHTLVTVPISGATAALAAVCETQGPTAQVLTLTRAAPDGDRLALMLRSPTGRTTKVLAVRAAGVAFTGRPLGVIDGNESILWLDPLPTCPADWRTAGLPRSITVDIDAGGPATLDLDTGYALARWLRTGPCAGSRT